jgi:hypothetical protein
MRAESAGVGKLRRKLGFDGEDGLSGLRWAE